MGKTLIIYGSTTGNTQLAAEAISKKLAGLYPELIDASKASKADLTDVSNLILGASTWGAGDLQDDWENYLPKLSALDLSGKKIALFGLGDAASYPGTFVDAIGIIYDAIKDKGCELVGRTSTQGYTFEDSKALDSGSFLGLVLDEENDGNLTEERISKWASEILPKLG
jgi:flavodoxin I